MFRPLKENPKEFRNLMAQMRDRIAKQYAKGDCTADDRGGADDEGIDACLVAYIHISNQKT